MQNRLSDSGRVATVFLGLLLMFAVAGCHRNSMNDEIAKSGTSDGVRFTAEASVSPDKADIVFVALRAVRTILGDSLPTGLYRAVIGADSQLRGGFVAPEIALR